MPPAAGFAPEPALRAGTTNLVATDSEGNAVLNLDVSVVSQGESTVTLTRGPSGQLSYNCTPRCERIPGVGDNPDSYDAIMKQVAGALSAGIAMALSNLRISQ